MVDNFEFNVDIKYPEHIKKESTNESFEIARGGIGFNLADEVYSWLQENTIREEWTLWAESLIKDEKNVCVAIINFKNSEDAMAFKLRWL